MTTAHRPMVLVIEDNTAVRQTLGIMVERSGYDVRLAGSGDEGVRVLGRHQEEVAAVVLDLQMPGKDGPQTLTELRALTPNLPCVFVTGFSPYPPDELAARGAVVLSKPVGPEELERALAKARSGRTSTRSR